VHMLNTVSSIKPPASLLAAAQTVYVAKTQAGRESGVASSLADLKTETDHPTCTDRPALINPACILLGTRVVYIRLFLVEVSSHDF
jgi:hypothetical protein